MRRRLAISLVLLAAVLAPSARADAPTQTGWWWSGHISQLPVSPPPPDVPEGGLYVAGGVTGASGVSALRFALPPGASAPTLTLHIAAMSGTVVLGACRISAPWQAAKAGAWDTRPAPDCEKGAVAAEVITEGERSVARLDLAALVDGDVLDVMLLPGKDPATGADATFDVRFDPPGPDSLAVTPTPAPNTGAHSSPSAAASPTPAPGVAAAAPLPATPVPPAAPFTPAANVSGAASAPDAVNSAPLAATPASAAPAGESDGRIVGLVLGALLLAVWLLTSRTDLGTHLRSLSGDSGQDLRGIGRFAAPRDSAPPPL